ncbi:MAG: glycosyltransferase family 4 protein [Acidimicrobiales bacterium]
MSTDPKTGLEPITRRIDAVVKGRGPRKLLADFANLSRSQGARGVIHRAFHEAARALASLPAPERRNLHHTHAFGVAGSQFYGPTSEELAANRRVTERFSERPTEIQTATWFIPWFTHALFGGINTIFRFIEWTRIEHGVEPRVVFYDHPDLTDAQMRSIISGAFPSLADIDIVVPPKGRSPYVAYEELPPTDIAICTIWYSAYALLRFNATKAKFYFVQDYEPAFYPAGSLWAQAEATYRFGYAGLVNSPGLAETYALYGNPSQAFIPGVDEMMLSSTRDGDDTLRPTQVAIYGRPNTDRNGFELLAATARLLKDRYGDEIRIVSAGEDYEPAEYDLAGIIENVGLLSTRESIADLYSRSDIGLYCMFSQHPSYQPLEYLATGMAVVTNINPFSSWLLRDGENCLLTEPFAADFAEAVSALVDNPELRTKLAATGQQLVRTFGWRSAFETLWRFIVRDEAEAGAS